VKFIADGMLGKLTRWLRMLGHDVEYSSKLDDAHFITIAKNERRTLLTRDLQLYQQAIAKGIEAFYFEPDDEAEELAQLARRFDLALEIDMKTSRCPKCNTPVKPISRENAALKVEENTISHYSDFWQCPRCGQVYWQGAHWTRIRKTLQTAKEKAVDMEKRSQDFSRSHLNGMS
jgi:uncharacterized protein with PIN domain